MVVDGDSFGQRRKIGKETRLVLPGVVAGGDDSGMQSRRVCLSELRWNELWYRRDFWLTNTWHSNAWVQFACDMSLSLASSIWLFLDVCVLQSL